MFNYRADRLPITIITLFFALDIGIVVMVYNPWILVTWAVLGILPKVCVCAWNHHHQHVSTFKWPVLNGLLEVMYSFQTGALPSTWVMHHNIGHHVNYMNQSKDESRWQKPDGTTMGTHEYAFHNVVWAYPRMWAIGQRYKKHLKRFIRWTVVAVSLLALAVWWNWLGALLIIVVPMATSLYATVWHTYYHHSGLTSTSSYGASYNIIHKGYNLLMGNLGYHTAHHHKQGVHWSALPALHAQIEAKIPVECYRAPSIPYKWFGPPAYIPLPQNDTKDTRSRKSA